MEVDCIFGIKKDDIVSIVGAGGKTSLMYLLAEKVQGKRLIATSTKIYKPKRYIFLESNSIKLEEKVYVSAKEELDDGKIAGINPDVEFSLFDYVFIEADGSQGKSLKGWREDEPVVLKNTNVTCGVVDISVIGKKTTEDYIFRKSFLEKLTKISNNVTVENLRDIIVSENGLFRNSVGRNILYINKVESIEDWNVVDKLIKMLLEDKEMELDRIIAGSLKNEHFRLLYSKELVAVLASGKSTRMGEDKLSIKINGRMLIENVMDKFAFETSKVLVCNDSRFKEKEKEYGFITLLNKEYEKGQSESIKCIVKNIEAKDYMFVLGDQPFIKKESLFEMWQLSKHGEKGIVAGKYNEIIGAPVIINRKYKRELLELKGDRGAKSLIMKHLEDVCFYELDEKEFIDIDSKEDMRKWCDVHE